ncbi:hypothetical protein [Cellulophaga baltica]|uniref:hypothetical protein n=1 Tax=Cellulophaga baltica TaxID=76594 RepID=UPI002494EA20|nr:hypothetical protein [Cellulophaga baltica]
MAIDYVKILIENPDIQHLLDVLDFNSTLSEKTGELSEKKIAEYHFCKITIFNSGLVLFTGSIHKLYNSLKGVKAPNYKASNYKGFNGNIFTLANILEVRWHLTKLFRCQPKQMLFQNIEFGINIEPNFDPQLFIKGLLYHHGKEFEFRYNKYYAQVVHSRYLVKIYNKSNQYSMRNYTLRIETKHLKEIDFKETGIKTFENINSKTLNRALKLLIKRFDEVVYYDRTIVKVNLSNKQKLLLNNYSNITYWFDDLKANKRDTHKKKLKSFIQDNSKNLHEQIRSNLAQKGVIINRKSKNLKRVIINSSSIGLINTPKKPRICPISNLDISMQKRSSKLLSNTGLKYYEKQHPKTFKLISDVFLTGRYNKYENDVYSRISKQIRNKYYGCSFSINNNQQNLFN